VKAGVSAVPVIGGSLVAVIGDTLERRRERVSEFGEAAVAASEAPEALVERMQRDERISDLFLDGAVLSASTSMAAKASSDGKGRGPGGVR
jgi:hypothetical protein